MPRKRRHQPKRVVVKPPICGVCKKQHLVRRSPTHYGWTWTKVAEKCFSRAWTVGKAHVQLPHPLQPLTAEDGLDPILVAQAQQRCDQLSFPVVRYPEKDVGAWLAVGCPGGEDLAPHLEHWLESEYETRTGRPLVDDLEAYWTAVAEILERYQCLKQQSQERGWKRTLL